MCPDSLALGQHSQCAQSLLSLAQFLCQSPSPKPKQQQHLPPPPPFHLCSVLFPDTDFLLRPLNSSLPKPSPIPPTPP